MSYESIAGWAQVIAMSIFGLVMAGVLFYALRPGNKAKFDKAARAPLVVEEELPEQEMKRSTLVRDEDENGGTSNGRP